MDKGQLKRTLLGTLSGLSFVVFLLLESLYFFIQMRYGKLDARAIFPPQLHYLALGLLILSLILFLINRPSAKTQ